MKPFIYMGDGVNKLIFGITGTEEPQYLLSRRLGFCLESILNL
ncbi:hypothetical protein NIES806_09220 [Dolichospermum compactum NIES-806]|uniref:Uncharacterized protein n=1 Tax=Dolichospermum compactum NIES-806 TaxID=1973481 RepID=A0A1Z4UZP9_9CYAN|nr:hypothetical protein NIES806_09220 [Dolichospermum compactum NIES-806]